MKNIKVLALVLAMVLVTVAGAYAAGTIKIEASYANGMISYTIDQFHTMYSIIVDGVREVNNVELSGAIEKTLAEGEHTIKVVDWDGCEGETKITVGGTPTPPVVDPLAVAASYTDGKIVYKVTGGKDPIKVTLGEEAIGTEREGAVEKALQPGTYTVKATDADGKTAEAAIVIEAPADTPAYTIVIDPITMTGKIIQTSVTPLKTPWIRIAGSYYDTRLGDKEGVGFKLSAPVAEDGTFTVDVTLNASQMLNLIYLEVVDNGNTSKFNTNDHTKYTAYGSYTWPAK